MENERIGHRTNPHTGEQDWIEMNDIDQLMLDPSYLEMLGHGNIMVEYPLSYNEILRTAIFKAICFVNQKEYSASVDMDEMEFANEVFDASYNDKLIDESEKIKLKKKQALDILQKKLFEDGIFLGSVSFSGKIGIIVVDSKIVGTINSLSLNTISPELGEINVEGVISNADLQNVELRKEIYYLDDNCCIKAVSDENFIQTGTALIGEAEFPILKINSSNVSKEKGEYYEKLINIVLPNSTEDKILKCREMLEDGINNNKLFDSDMF